MAAALLAAAGLFDLAMLRSLDLLNSPRLLPAFRPLVRAVAASRPRAPDAPSEGVTIVFLDGLRLDAVEHMPTLARLAREGAFQRSRALFPTFTRVGYATIASGAGPLVHGYLSNLNRTPARLPSIFDQARVAGLQTRQFYVGRGAPPSIFPEAFGTSGPLPEAGPPRAGGPHLTFVYVPEPDATAHVEGGGGEAYRRATLVADAALARVAAGLDLARETLLVVTDHGHIDRGGHGGHEEVVTEIPLVAAGRGIRAGTRIEEPGATDLRDVAATIAWLLGIDPPPSATGRALRGLLDPAPPNTAPWWGLRVRPAPEDPEALAWLRAALLGAALAALPTIALGVRDARAVAAGLLVAPLVGYGLYAFAWGRPASFSCVNSYAEVRQVMLTVFALAVLGAAVGAAAAGGLRRYAPGGLTAAALLAGGFWGYAGLAAPLVLAHPHAAFLAHLALTGLLAHALLALVAAALPARGGAEGLAPTRPCDTVAA